MSREGYTEVGQCPICRAKVWSDDADGEIEGCRHLAFAYNDNEYLTSEQNAEMWPDAVSELARAIEGFIVVMADDHGLEAAEYQLPLRLLRAPLLAAGIPLHEETLSSVDDSGLSRKNVWALALELGEQVLTADPKFKVRSLWSNSPLGICTTCVWSRGGELRDFEARFTAAASEIRAAAAGVADPARVWIE